MRPEIHWLLHFCSENKLLTSNQITGMVTNLDPSMDVDSVARLLTSTGWVTDTDFLTEAVTAANQNTQEGFELPEIPGIELEMDTGFTGFPAFSTFNTLSDAELFKAVKTLFVECQKIGASDLHITGGARPRIRHHRRIVYLSNTPLSDKLARRINLILLNESQRKQFELDLDLDYALTIDGIGEHNGMRFRANLMEHKNGISGVYRVVANRLMSLEELGFPNAPDIRKLLAYHNGIILVTGPAGSGKTTTLASLVNELNQSRQEHIITVEDPIEVMQESANSIVTQRQIGDHTQSFHTALKSALREDPDIIVIGEMRDLETIEMAVTAAETGHLVIATMHTRDAISTLNRLLDVFPPRQQSQIRAMTAGSLRGILCQRLLPSVNDEVVLACELLVNTNAVANIIRDGKQTGLNNVMQSGKKYGMRTMNDSVKELLEAGKISAETAATHTYNTED
ncbi:PilT/PilU family type 4a pilus ATPase [Coraliomargarita sp. SDUM461004]|uniref:PilT/PilU family type 4a pilus ATPase n=1 Tax=Thalassobacterium sedimentorum TaxID=3041258 RepID=A0ABU1AGZ0_9BACT|nr:PilT/PilU family type 4a pilus ATPase [Coraliomargarita sp. SDUM461004]MDQ8193443.1 PilT/PilU family type 4a pilus ATPase [Coraliomargarita sp. SDUM461004]